MAAGSQGISVAGFSLISPLLQLVETLETASPVEPNEVQTGGWENGYSAAIVVLSVLLLESAINRLRYFEKQEGRKPKPAEYFATISPTCELAKAVNEVFALRDVIVHSHVWDVRTRFIRGQGLTFVEPPKIRKNYYGDQRFTKVMDPESRLSRYLRFNFFPSRIWRHDAHIVLRTVKQVLMALDSVKPTYRGVHNFPCEFRGQDMSFYEVIEEVLKDQGKRKG
jgi:hypothetical protein